MLLTPPAVATWLLAAFLLLDCLALRDAAQQVESRRSFRFRWRRDLNSSVQDLQASGRKNASQPLASVNPRVPEAQAEDNPKPIFDSETQWCPEEIGEAHHGISVASWRWDFVRLPLMFTGFVILAGLTKLIFHHADFLSSIVPESCMLILLGTLVGGVSRLAESTFIPNFSPRVFFLFLLPPIILEAAYSLHHSAFFSNIGTILLYAVVGTIINAFTIGLSIYALATIGAIGHMQLDLVECLVFSSLISAVDPVAVLAIFQEVGVNKVLYFLVFGESLLNDAVTVVLYNMMVSFAGSEVSFKEIGLGIASFLVGSMGAVLIGSFMGAFTAFVTKFTHEVRVVEPLALLGVAYLSYLSAELVHFSGIISIICCGLMQVQYATSNISAKSYTTVKYFTKMLGAVCDTIIFICLGIVLVNKKHNWHTGFVLWTTLLCLVFRFLSVFSLTYLVNAIGRLKNINLEEQFIMAYGGLRGAVSFSLVIMLSTCKFQHYEVFVTTTLFVILFTVFIQGASVKPLVNLLKIRKHQAGEVKLFTEINLQIVDHVMFGIEEILGTKGGNYWKNCLSQLDEKYLKPLLLHKSAQSNIARIYSKVVLADHYAHLYGPATALEDKVPLHIQKSFDQSTGMPLVDPLLIVDEEEDAAGERSPLISKLPLEKRKDLGPEYGPTRKVRFTKLSAEVLRKESVKDVAPRRRNTLIPGVLKHPSDSVDEDPAKLLHKALKDNPYNKFHQTYNKNLVGEEQQEIDAHLRARRLRARRLTMVVSPMMSREDEGDFPSDTPHGGHRRSVQLRNAGDVDNATTFFINRARRRSTMLKKSSRAGSIATEDDSLHLYKGSKLERQSAITESVENLGTAETPKQERKKGISEPLKSSPKPERKPGGIVFATKPEIVKPSTTESTTSIVGSKDSSEKKDTDSSTVINVESEEPSKSSETKF